MKRSLLRAGIALLILLAATGFALAAGTADAAAAKAPVEITWFAWRGIPGPNAPIPAMVDELVGKKVGFPVHIKFVGGVADGDMHATQQMMLAANELPDVFNRFSVDPEWNAQSATKFSLDTFKQYMPMEYKFLGGLMDQLALDPKATWGIYSDPADGMLWGVPRIWDTGWIPSGQMWRKDILDELGYAIPTTIAEAEKVFEAYKAVYPNKYAMTGRGKTDWQCFDLVFNAYGLNMMWQQIRDGKVVQPWATRQFREALIVLRRWYEKGFWDPDFPNQALEWIQNFAAGNYIVTQWVGNGEWDFNSGLPVSYLEKLREIPGASAVAATHIAADKNTKPAQAVWNPFLTQQTSLGKHLESDLTKLHQVMQVGDTIALDREVKLLSGNGIEGTHYFFPEGETTPQFFPEISAMPVAEQMDKFGFGFCYQGNFSTNSWLSKRTQKKIDDYVMSPSGPYHSSKLTLLYPIVQGPVKDLKGEVVQVATPSSWFQLTVDIMTGAKPIEYYDEWLQSYYDSGGRAWEEHATRLYGPKK
jgi:putative aldouronate transport system substrate-binding protein